MCSIWACLNHREDAEHTDGQISRGYYMWGTILDLIGDDCDEHRVHVQAMQAFGVLSYAFCVITWVMHVSNMMCRCCKCMKPHFWILHATQAGVITIYWSLMVATFNSEFCGASLKDDGSYRLDVNFFGNAIVAWLATIIMSVLSCPHMPGGKHAYKVTDPVTRGTTHRVVPAVPEIAAPVAVVCPVCAKYRVMSNDNVQRADVPVVAHVVGDGEIAPAHGSV